MPDVNDARAALKAARRNLADAERSLDHARRRRLRAEVRYGSAIRRSQSDEQRRMLRLDVDKVQNEEREARRQLEEARKVDRERTRALADAADPRRAISAWNAATPILLFPVRLETRFRHVPADRRAGAARDELWVRIYPDVCSIDTFETTLSETEVASAKRYWIETWAAGGIDAQRRAAWRNLVVGHGAGRAAWILHEYAPAGAEPAKVDPYDVLLVIATDTPPTAATQAALSAYWKAVWLAEGSRTAIEAATAALSIALGGTDPAPLIAQFEPANLDVRPAPPRAKSQVTVETVWLTLPTPADVRVRSWSAPARVHVLPDRFIVLGYQSGQLVFDAEGRPIPSPLVAGPDPAAPAEEQIHHDANGQLVVPEDMRWMVDFERAVEVGMGIKVPLDPAKVRLDAPIERVIALGIRLSDDSDEGRLAVETLLRHHRYGRAGFGFAPQGTATNNTEAEGAGYSEIDDADASFDALRGVPPAPPGPSDWWQRSDGEWLADGLGIDPEVLRGVPHAARRDFACARAMNRALWPATFGYSMGTMLHPVFSADQIEATRWFYTHFVTGRGFLPAVRIGNQPYGVLPVSALSRWKWLDAGQAPRVAGLAMPSTFGAYAQGLFRVLATMRADWTLLADGVSHVGKSGDPHQLLLDVLGLHPTSVEFHQRYAESLHQIFNHARLLGFGSQILEHIRVAGLQQQALALLRRLGYAGSVEPDALQRFFFTRALRLNGPTVDDLPLSERTAIRAYTSDGRNYVQWLADSARNSFEDLRLERGFIDDHPPTALLYLMLRHAVLLGYWESGLRRHEAAGVMTPDELVQIRREPVAIHVSEAGPSESRYGLLVSIDPRVSGDVGRNVADAIRGTLDQAVTSATLADQIAALDLVKDASTAELERCLAEHIDTASYRLDAWLLGLVNFQLAALRYTEESTGGHAVARRGVYLGAYGWLEHLQRKTQAFEPVEPPNDVAAALGIDGNAPLQRDPANGGYVFAPSINQATTAAILRAGYLANSAPSNPGTLAVNLSSARVRVALGLIDGLRNGQPLGALLGYRLQRGLHEHHAPLELDKFIHPLRQRFPLVANQLASTRDQTAAIETLEANNVIDGLKLVEHVSAGVRSYPFGLDLPPATDGERAAIDVEVDALLDARDALADLALAEAVHQAVLGNYDRVAATFDAYATGTFPPEPEIVRTPRSGLLLTHRVGLQFEAGVLPDFSPVSGVAASPRSTAQPMVNAWLSSILPNPLELAVRVDWIDPVTSAVKSEIVTQRDLRLQPLDLLCIATLDGDAAMGELDDRIVRYVLDTRQPRADAVLTIRHTARLASPLKSFFEVMPLLRHLRAVLFGSRPLAATDVALAGEAARAQDATQFIARDRVAKVRDVLNQLRQDVVSFNASAGTVDVAIEGAVGLFERAARFGIAQVGWGFTYEWRRRAFAALLGRVRDVVARWDARLSQYATRLAEYGVQSSSMTEAEQFTALGRLDLLVSATAVSPRPLTPAAYEAALPARRQAFETKRLKLNAILAIPDRRLAALMAAVQAELPLSAFDAAPFAIDDEAADIARFVQDLQGRVAALRREIETRLKTAADRLQSHDATIDAGARVRALQAAGSALLGDDIRLIPEFTFGATHATELANAYAAGASGALMQYVTGTAGVEFPVEDWLVGVARVRDKLFAWEQAMLLAVALGGKDAALTPIQLPFAPGEGWLALQFDPAWRVEGERLLYTAHHAVPPNPGGATCGLLIDEWTEVVPVGEETAGLTFNFDRPGSEPPQAWLLTTPARIGGEWQWSDLLGAVHEALDLGRLRTVEPAQVDTLAYSRFLPATVSAVTMYGVSIAANYARMNDVAAILERRTDG